MFSKKYIGLKALFVSDSLSGLFIKRIDCFPFMWQEGANRKFKSGNSPWPIEQRIIFLAFYYKYLDDLINIYLLIKKLIKYIPLFIIYI
jgi:hypothetical protein